MFQTYDVLRYYGVRCKAVFTFIYITKCGYIFILKTKLCFAVFIKVYEYF